MDNHPVHKSLNSLKFFKEKGIKVIDNHPYSLDLNPMKIFGENQETDYEKRVSEYQSLAVLTEDIEKWDSITDNQLKNYSSSMKDRIYNCLLLEGMITKY